jgi:hypothetical protein
MIIRMFNKLKEDIQKLLDESQENMGKKSRRHRNKKMNSKISTHIRMKLMKLFLKS